MIECYYSSCPKHSVHDGEGDGPFCYEPDCSAITEELDKYDKIREAEKAKWIKIVHLEKEN